MLPPTSDPLCACRASGQPSDACLVRRTLAGERAAFDRLAHRYERSATGAAQRLLSDWHDAQEVVQVALLRAYRRLERLQEPDRFGPWFLRIVINLALNYRRDRAARRAVRSLDGGLVTLDDAHATSHAVLPEAELRGRELAARVQVALAGLPEKQRAALLLFVSGRMPQKEIAQVLGVSVDAVKWHVHTARRKLRAAICE